MATIFPPPSSAPTPPADPSPAVVAAPPVTPGAPAAVKPGWATSEHLLTVLAVVVNALIASNVIPTGSDALKIAMVISTTLGAFGYGVIRTVIKTNAANDNSAIPNMLAGLGTLLASATTKAAGALLLIGVLALGGGMLTGCTGCKSAGGASSGSGGGSGLAACSVANLEQAVGNKTLLGAVAADLLSGNYEAALAALAANVGLGEVNCAVVAFADLESALETAGAGSGSAAPRTADAARGTALANANAYIVAHGLR